MVDFPFPAIAPGRSLVGRIAANPGAISAIEFELVQRALMSATPQDLTLVNGANDDVAVETGPFTFLTVIGPTADFSITGLQSGVSGNAIYLHNPTDYAMTLAHESTDSIESNRLMTPEEADIVLPAKSFALLVYDAEIRWSVVFTSRFGGQTHVRDVTLANGANHDVTVTLDAFNLVRIIGPSAAFNVTGFAGGAAGKSMFLFNSVSQTMTLTHNAGSVGANRLTTLTGSDIVLPTSSPSFAMLVYDVATSRWIVVMTSSLPAASTTSAIPLGRLSLTSAVAITEADVAGSASVYWTPTGSQKVPVFDSLAFAAADTGGGLTLALDSNSGHTGYQESGKNFDLFIFNDGGTVRLGSGPAWNAGAGAGSNIARGTGAGSTELEMFQGILVNKNTMTARFGSASGNTVSVPARQATYIGSMRMTANGQTDDTIAKRFVFNAYNAVPRTMRRHDATASWNYSTASPQQANANTANKVEYLHGLSGIELVVESWGTASNSGATVRYPKSSIGIDALTQHADVRATFPSVTNTVFATAVAQYRGYPGIGYHAVNWLEVGAGADTQTWYGTSISGLHASTMM